MEPRQQKFSVGYFIGTLVVLLLLQSFLFAPHRENLSYSEFKTLVAKGKVTDLVLDKQVITGTLAPEGLEGVLPKQKLEELKRYGGGAHAFITARVDDPGLVAELAAAKVRFTGRVENTWLTTLLSWVLPALVFFGLWALLVRRMGPQGGLMAIGKSKAKVYVERRAGALVLVVAAALAAGASLASAQGRPAMGPMPMMPGTATPQTAPETSASATPERHFYRERTFVVTLGGAALAAGALGVYAALRLRRRAAVRALNEAVLVVDLVESTHLATHYGDTLAMRARNALKDRALDVARLHGLAFAESTGDGWFMTFPSVAAAVESSIGLLRSLREDPPDLAPAPPLEARAAVSFGEILLDARGRRHGAVINRAHRLVGLSHASFARVEGEGGGSGEIPDRNRILLDEEAAQELRAAEAPRRFLGFCSLKGFPGLHRVYEVVWATQP